MWPYVQANAKGAKENFLKLKQESSDVNKQIRYNNLQSTITVVSLSFLLSLIWSWVVKISQERKKELVEQKNGMCPGLDEM